MIKFVAMPAGKKIFPPMEQIPAILVYINQRQRHRMDAE